MPKTLDLIGPNVRALRERRGWSQAFLADQADISLRSVVRLEAGYDTHASTLIAIAEALGTSLDRLRES